MRRDPSDVQSDLYGDAMNCEFCFDRPCSPYLKDKHDEARAARSGDPDAIRAWLKRQESASDYGGICDYDHDTADAIIEKLLQRIAPPERTA